MQRPGLYFPFIHIRDDDWLKSAALYWPSVRRLVPSGYAKHDSPTAQTFFEAGLLQDEVPNVLVDSVTWDLLRTLKKNAYFLRRKYSIKRATAYWRGQEWGEGSGEGRNPKLGWIHVTKFQPDVVNFLADEGLAQCGRSNSRWDDWVPADPWIGLHPALAGAYMTALASRVSEQVHFEPLTDQSDLRIATPNSDVQSALSLLLGRKVAGPIGPDFAAEGVATYIMLALQYARPKNLGNVSAETIVNCRDSLQEELQSFRAYVDSQRSELAELAAIPIERRRLESFAAHVEQTIEDPLRKLEKGLRLNHLEPARSLLLTSSVAPPLVVDPVLQAVGATPHEGIAAGTVAAVGSAWWAVGRIRAEAKASSPVGYLLDVRDALTPKTLAARMRKFLGGTYSRTR